MSSGSQRPFVSVKFSPVGRTYSFLIPELALDAPQDGELSDSVPRHAPATPPFLPGDSVIVQTAEGRALGKVTRSVPALAARRVPEEGSEARVVRRATREDVVMRLKHQQREQDAQRICNMKIRERG